MNDTYVYTRRGVEREREIWKAVESEVALSPRRVHPCHGVWGGVEILLGSWKPQTVSIRWYRIGRVSIWIVEPYKRNILLRRVQPFCLKNVWYLLCAKCEFTYSTTNEMRDAFLNSIPLNSSWIYLWITSAFRIFRILIVQRISYDSSFALEPRIGDKQIISVYENPSINMLHYYLFSLQN